MKDRAGRQFNRMWVDTNRNWAGAAKKEYTPLEEREDWDGKVEVMTTAFEFDRVKKARDR